MRISLTSLFVFLHSVLESAEAAHGEMERGGLISAATEAQQDHLAPSKTTFLLMEMQFYVLQRQIIPTLVSQRCGIHEV